MASLTYFTVVGEYFAAAGEGPYDVGDPPLAALSGTIIFTPLVAAGSPIQGATLAPPTNLLLAPVKAVVQNGQVMTNGVPGARLVANTPVLNLSGALVYQVSFEGGLTARAKTYFLNSFNFTAPTSDTTVDLVTVTPAPGITASGGTIIVHDVDEYTNLAAFPITGQSAHIYVDKSTNLLYRWDTTALAYTSTGGGVREWESYANLAAFPAMGDPAKEYIAQDTGKLYRWNGSAYVELSVGEPPIAVGSSSQYWRGDKTWQQLNVAALTDGAALIETVTTLTGAAIQAAMNSFGGNPGVVMLKPGAIYTQTTIADQVSLPSNITLLMNGATLQLTTAAGVSFTQIINADTTNGNSHISIIGPGVIDGNAAVAGHSSGLLYQIELHKCGYLTLDNLEIKNGFRNGLIILGDAVAQSRYVNLTNIVAHNCGGFGIYVGNGQRAVNWTNVTVHDCVGWDVTGNGLYSSAVIDASEQIVNGLYAYGNSGVGIYIRNVFACAFNNFVATRNGTHGIYSVAMTDSTGSNWLAIDNGDATSNTYSDIYFEGTGTPTWGYGTTAGTVITGVRCGPVVSAAGYGNWLEAAHTGLGKENYAIYFEDAIGSFNGDVRLLNVEAIAGLTDKIRYPATIGNLVVTTGREPWDGAPSTVTVLATTAPKNTTGFSAGVFTGTQLLNMLCASDSAQNDLIEWDVAMAAGTWTLNLLNYKGAANGIYTVTIDGSTIGTIDGYAASGAQANSAITGIAVKIPGRHTIRFAMLTKNASSSAYTGQINGFTMTRTGA